MHLIGFWLFRGFYFNLLLSRRRSDGTHENEPTDDDTEVGCEEPPENGKDRHEMIGNDEGHESRCAGFGKETGSWSGTEIDKKNQENLDGDHLV